LTFDQTDLERRTAARDRQHGRHQHDRSNQARPMGGGGAVLHQRLHRRQLGAANPAGADPSGDQRVHARPADHGLRPRRAGQHAMVRLADGPLRGTHHAQDLRPGADIGPPCGRGIAYSRRHGGGHGGFRRRDRLLRRGHEFRRGDRGTAAGQGGDVVDARLLEPRRLCRRRAGRLGARAVRACAACGRWPSS